MTQARLQGEATLGSFPFWVKAVLVVLALFFIAAGVWFYRFQTDEIRQETYESLETIAALKADQVAQWRLERFDDAALLMESPFLVNALSRWLDSGGSTGTEDVLARFRSLQEHYSLSDVSLFDKNGSRRLSLTRYLSDPLHPSVLEAMERSFREGRPIFTDLHVTPGHQDPHLDVVVPLVKEKRGVAERVGSLILQHDARHFLFPLVQSWPVPSRTAETLLVRREGDGVLYLNDLRHRSGTALSLRIPLSRSDLPAAMAAQGRQGIVRGKDYRGVDVLAVLRPIHESPWFLVAKVDAAEALSPVHRQSLLLLALLIGLTIAAASMAAVVWQRTEKLHYRSLAEAEAGRRQTEEKYRVTLMSVGDGVIVTGPDECVQLMNPACEALTGWTSAEASGRPFEEVFVMIDEKTRQTSANPVARAMRQNAVVGLANHTALISRDGSEIPIEDSAAPIRDTEGRAVGVILVFHDVTEKRRAEDALRKAHDELETRVQERTADLARQAELINLAHDAIIVRDLDDRITFWNRGAEEMYGWKATEAEGRVIHQLLSTELPEGLDTMKRHILAGGRWDGEVSHRRKDGSRITVLSRRVLRNNGEEPSAIMEINIDITDRKKTELALRDAHQRLELQVEELSLTHHRLIEEMKERERVENQLKQSQKLETVGTLAAGIAHDFNNILLSIIGFSEMARDLSPEDSEVRQRIDKVLSGALRGRDLVKRVLTFSRKADPDKQPLSLATVATDTITLLQPVIPPGIDVRVSNGSDSCLIMADAIQMQQVIMNLCTNAAHALKEREGAFIAIELEPCSFASVELAPHSGLIPGHYVKLSVSDNGAGMAPEVLERVFDPFFTTKNAGHGTGLGLSVVHGIVANHGGAITVSSAPGEGTVFAVYLPCHGHRDGPAPSSD